MVAQSKLPAALVFVVTFCAVLAGSLYFMNRPQTVPAHPPEKVYSEVPRTYEPVGTRTSLFNKEVYIGGKAPLTYYLYEPENKPSGKIPLVTVLHGTPGNAYAAEYLSEEPYRTRYAAYILVPVLPKADTWSYPQSEKIAGQRERMDDVAALIDDLAGNLPIDRKRLYVMGCSDGGYGAFGAALHYPDLFAASAPISGGWDKEDVSGLTRIPLRVVHGGEDKNVLPERSRDVSHAIEKAGGSIVYIEKYDMGHECPSRRLYGDELWSWMFAQHK